MCPEHAKRIFESPLAATRKLSSAYVQGQSAASGEMCPGPTQKILESPQAATKEFSSVSGAGQEDHLWQKMSRACEENFRADSGSCEKIDERFKLGADQHLR